MRNVIFDGCTHLELVRYDYDSVFSNGLVAAGAGTLESTDPVLLIASAKPTLRMFWTTGAAESADFEIRIRLFAYPLDPAGPFASLQVAFGLTAVGAAGINGNAFTLRENAMPAEISYGYADVQIINNDLANPLQGVYGEILMEKIQL